ncbi:MAG: hypothetical protein KJ566_00045 [Nanoarchaeota archaeon]|nr:hypothetical protein [Nanoarchaeota archaeon]
MSLLNLTLQEKKDLYEFRRQSLLDLKKYQGIKFNPPAPENLENKTYYFISNGTSDQAYTIYGHLFSGNLEKAKPIFCGLEISELIKTSFEKLPLIN